MTRPLRSHIKSATESVLVRSGVSGMHRRRLRGRSLVLAYHNVLPDRAEPGADTSLHLPRHRFVRQLDLLERSHEVVPLEQLLDDSPTSRSRPRAAITFDDAYRGAVSVGVAELARRNLPATVFVAPAFLEGRSFWWDAVVDIHGNALSAENRDHALWRLDGDDRLVRDWADRNGLVQRAVPEWATVASAGEIDNALEHPGLTLASHSWSHPNLAALEGAALDEELQRPLHWLQDRFSRVIPWLAYPYGLSTPNVEQAATAAGYRAAVRVNGGYSAARMDNPYAMPRLNVPSAISTNGFRLRLAGLFTQ